MHIGVLSYYFFVRKADGREIYMASGSFFAFLDRMKYIGRWGLMRSTIPENVQEHSMQVAVLAHALAIIGRDIYGKNVNPDFIASSALYHDLSEIATGDLPAPVKYLNRELLGAYKNAEKGAKDKLFQTVPAEIKDSYKKYLYLEEDDPELYKYIKAADKLSAYIKCVAELKTGNAEFRDAEKSLKGLLCEMAENLEELSYFMDKILPYYTLTLDEL